MKYIKDKMPYHGSEVSVCRIDYGDLDLKRTDGLDKDPYCGCFMIETYKKLGWNISSQEADDGIDSWEAAFAPINNILELMSEDHQRQVMNFFIDARHLVLSTPMVNVDIINKVTRQLDDMIFGLNISIKLREQFHTYAIGGMISYPDLSNVGTRAHDRPEYTFFENEYHALTEIVLICKMLAPLWGEIIYRTKDALDTNFKEVQCITTLYSYLNSYGQLFEKFMEYIYNAVNEKKSRPDPTDVTTNFNGYTPSPTVMYILGTMLVKKFVNIDIHDPTYNTMTYVNSCARTTYTTNNTNLMRKNRASERRDYTKDEGNTSALEAISFMTRYPADTPNIIEHALDQSISEMINKFGLSRSTYQEMLRFYRRNPLEQTTINYYLVATTFGHLIGGGSGVELLNALAYSKVVSFVQLLMASKGFASDMVHLMSAQFTEQEQDNTNHRLNVSMKFNITSSEEHRNCKNMFTEKIGNLSWDTCLLDIVNEVTSVVTIYRSPPVLFAMLEEEEQNGLSVIYTEYLVRHICAYILFVANEVLPPRME